MTVTLAVVYSCFNKTLFLQRKMEFCIGSTLENIMYHKPTLDQWCIKTAFVPFGYTRYSRSNCEININYLIDILDHYIFFRSAVDLSGEY